MPGRLAFLFQVWLSPRRVALILVSSFLLPIATDCPVSAQDIPPELKADLLAPWRGDFQGMLDRRTIRILPLTVGASFLWTGQSNWGGRSNEGKP